MVIINMSERQQNIIAYICDDQIRQFISMEPTETQNFLANVFKLKVNLLKVQTVIEESIQQFDMLKENPHKLYFINKENIFLVKHQLVQLQGSDQFDSMLYAHEFSNLWSTIGKVERLARLNLLPNIKLN